MKAFLDGIKSIIDQTMNGIDNYKKAYREGNRESRYARIRNRSRNSLDRVLKNNNEED